MSNRHVDSIIVEHNEDGSTTTTEIYTTQPATTLQKVGAGAALGALLLAPLVPLFAAVAVTKWEEKSEERKARKNQKNED